MDDISPEEYGIYPARLGSEIVSAEEVPYPGLMNCLQGSYSNYRYPKGFISEVKARFPKWKFLHRKIAENDSEGVWILLWKYYEWLSNSTPEQILKAQETGRLDAIAARAKVALEVAQFIRDIEKKYC